jgi:hypothetical protein
MFVGHFAAALAAKSIAPRASLGTLTFAAQWIDLLWPVLLLAGLERVRIEPGATATNPLVFEHYPWSHSLVAVLGWALLIGALHFAARRDVRTAIVIGALVASHWLLDLIVHVPDLPIAPGGPVVGAGLWNHRAAALLFELGLLAAATAIYVRATLGPRGVDRTARHDPGRQYVRRSAAERGRNRMGRPGAVAAHRVGAVDRSPPRTARASAHVTGGRLGGAPSPGRGPAGRMLAAPSLRIR